MSKLNPEDYVGKKYGHLTVTKKLEEKKDGCYLWEFLCDCGNVYVNKLSNVKNGNSKSCGCQKYKGFKEYNEKNRTIKIGDKFGKLTVLREVGLRPYTEGHSRMWYECLCDCGNICEKSGNRLKSGITKSCGCLKSAGELEIEKLLKEHQIIYKTEYVDQDLLREYNRRLRFDFAIFKDDKLSHYIEFQGRQHIEGFDTEIFSNASPLEVIQERDNIKREFCKKHNITLIEIPYSKKGRIKIEDLLI